MRSIFGATKSKNGRTPKLRLNRMYSGIVCFEQPTQTVGNKKKALGTRLRQRA